VALLRSGGNAFDAVLAAGFAAAVSEPGLTSLGGGGFLLVRPAGEPARVLDFFVDAPGRGHSGAELEPHFVGVTVRFTGAEQVFYVGAGSVAVPGCLAGYLEAHRTWGSRPLAEVVAPAQRLARDGVALEPTQATVLALLTDILTLSDDGRRVFAPTGQLPRVGDLVRNPAYADFLDRVTSDEVTGFDSPSVAEGLLSQIRAGGGLLTGADLATYRPVERAPLEVRYRGARVVTNPPPSFGGSIVADALTLLASSEGTEGDQAQVVAITRVLAEATEAQKRQRQATSSRGTTHVSVVDAAGNLAAMTTSNGSCSGVFAPGTGVQLNNVMGESDLHPDGFHATVPGTRIGSMMAPTLLELPDGRVVAMGSGGSERIRSALTQVVVNLADRGWPLHRAILAPRAHDDGQAVQVEPGLSEAALAGLAELRPTNVWSSRSLYFGGTHGVALHPDGRVEAAGDPRRDGVAVVLDL
jgi:gamma-glutamyltranspeptidase/glutathione hydrolase